MDSAESHTPFAVPFVLAALATTLLSGLLAFGHWFAPLLNWLPYVIFGGALEAVTTTFWLSRPERRLSHKPLLRVGEGLGLALLLRLIAWAVAGNWPTLADWRVFILRPALFFDPVFLYCLMLLAVAWAQAIMWAGLLVEMNRGLKEAEAFSQAKPAARGSYLDAWSGIARPALLQRLTESWVAGGIFLLLTSALTAVDIPHYDWSAALRTLGRLPMPDYVLLGLLVYFLAGFWLIGWARYQTLQGRWLVSGLHIQPQLARRWRRNGLMLVGAVSLLAAFLPIGSTFAVARLLQIIYSALIVLASACMGAVIFILSWLVGLLGHPTSSAPPTPTPPLPTPLPAIVGGAVTPNLAAQWVMGSLFWAVLVVFTLATAIFFLRERGYRLSLAWVGSWRRALAAAVRAVWRRLRGGVRTLARQVQRSRPVTPSLTMPASAWRLSRFGRLSPREQIRFFYLALVRRAGQQGAARQAMQTPLEYAPVLEAAWPENAPEVRALTQAFIRARYDRQPVTAEEATAIKLVWQRVRAERRKL